MAILEFKKREEEPKIKEKMSVIEMLDAMAEQMAEFVSHYYDEFLIDGIYQAIMSKQECVVMDDLVKKCSRDATTLIAISNELKQMEEQTGQIVATYGAVSAFQMATETVQKINLLNEEMNGRVRLGDVDYGKFEIIKKIKASFEGQYHRFDYDSLQSVSEGFYPFILVDILYVYNEDEDILYTIGFKNRTDALKYALSEGISGKNILEMWG